MKAAILVNNKKPLIVTNVEMPEKLDFGQVLVGFRSRFSWFFVETLAGFGFLSSFSWLAILKLEKS